MKRLFEWFTLAVATLMAFAAFASPQAAHAEEVVDSGGIADPVLENSNGVDFGVLNALNSGVGLDAKAWDLRVHISSNEPDAPDPWFAPREKNVYQLTVTSGSVSWYVYHVSQPNYPLAAGSWDLRFPEDGNVDVYGEEGYFFVNGRHWNTSCEPYSQTTRCLTNIWSSPVKYINGQYVKMTGWNFNNLTYLALMTKAQWGTNPLANTGSWTAADGRLWKTDCNTAVTGPNACRNYIWSSYVVSAPSGGYTLTNGWVLNSMLRFRV